MNAIWQDLKVWIHSSLQCWDNFFKLKEKKMTTLRETIQAKITAAEAEVTAAKQELAGLETTATAWLSHDITEVKSFFASVKKHLEEPL
jgi:hypothetical protein